MEAEGHMKTEKRRWLDEHKGQVLVVSHADIATTPRSTARAAASSVTVTEERREFEEDKPKVEITRCM